MKTRSLVLLGAALLALAGFARADDWPQWRGPNRDDISREKGLLTEWPKEGPKLLWTFRDAGSGYSSVAVVGDRLFTMGADAQQEYLFCLDLKTQAKVWNYALGARFNNGNGDGPRATPTVDGNLVFVLTGAGQLVCVNADSGDKVWACYLRGAPKGEKDLKGEMQSGWGYSESPLIDGDALVCTPGGKDATIVALHKKDAAAIWKCAVPDGDEAAYASAIVVEAGGVKQYVQFLQKGVVGVDAKTGKFLWRYDKTAKGSPANIPTPVAYKEFVYTGASRTGGGLVKVKADNDKFEAEQVYFDAGLPTSIGGAVRVGDYLYGTSLAGLLCVEFTTGKEKWKDRSVGPGSLCYADGRLYLHGENGEMALVEATPDGYKERGRFAPPEQPKHPRGQMEKAWAYPVVADGKLYVRDQGTLWCYDVKAEK